MLLDLYKVAERYTTAEPTRSDNKVGQTTRRRVGGGVVGRCVGDVVDEVLIVGVGQLLGLVVGYLGEDDGGETGGGAGGGGGVFG